MPRVTRHDWQGGSPTDVPEEWQTYRSPAPSNENMARHKKPRMELYGVGSWKSEILQRICQGMYHSSHELRCNSLLDSLLCAHRRRSKMTKSRNYLTPISGAH